MSLSFTPTQVFAISDASCYVDLCESSDPPANGFDYYEQPGFQAATIVVRAKQRFEREFNHYLSWKAVAPPESRSNLSEVRKYHRLLVGATRTFELEFQRDVSNHVPMALSFDRLRKSALPLEEIPVGEASEIDVMSISGQEGLSWVFELDFLRAPL